MINITPIWQSVKTATNKIRGCKPTACYEGWFIFLPSDANLTACSKTL
ncbi:MAG: hypothetical protein LBT27_09150 [Prevotellaceae bacterium]|nr:hypothetical protein [Prevotellaceae bacterium]